MQHLYISYPEDDYEFVHRLVDDLQAAGYMVFVDAVSQLGTLAWAAETRQAIRACGAVLMVLSLAEGRRIGIRHEGVLAKRRRKPVYVLLRSTGELPRYLQDAVVIDWSGDYETARAELMAALPEVTQLIVADAPLPRGPRTPRRPPRQVPRKRVRLRRWALVIILLVACVVVGSMVGALPVAP
jgi:hypothetical protein